MTIDSLSKSINILSAIRKINRTADIIKFFSVAAVFLVVAVNVFGTIKKNSEFSY